MLRRTTLPLLLSCLPRHSGLAASLELRRRRAFHQKFRVAASAPFTTAFQLPVEDGLCIALRLPAEAEDEVALPLDELHTLERERLEGMRPARRISFAGGRAAMRRALNAVCNDAKLGCPVLPDEVGAPVLPPGTLGSISHTHGLACAVVCVAPDELEELASATSRARDQAVCRAVGVDVERVGRVLSPRVATRCLHADERSTLDAPPSGLAAPAELLLRVSLKEALYKALHPLVRQTIRWHSVQVRSATLALAL